MLDGGVDPRNRIVRNRWIDKQLMPHAGNGPVQLLGQTRQSLVRVVDLALCQLTIRSGVIVSSLSTVDINDAGCAILQAPLSLIPLVQQLDSSACATAKESSYLSVSKYAWEDVRTSSCSLADRSSADCSTVDCAALS